MKTETLNNETLRDKLLQEHAESEKVKAEQRWIDFFTTCEIPTKNQKLIRENYNIYKKIK